MAAAERTPAPAPRADEEAASAAARHAAGFTQRRVMAAAGLAMSAGTLIIFGGLAVYALPHPPKAMGWTTLPKGEAGLTLPELGRVGALAAALTAAILALQEAALRPLLGAAHRQTTEAVFYVSSMLIRAVFLALLARHHLGPGRHDAAAVGDGWFRLPAVALFYAAYATDLVQMIGRYSDFPKSYTGMLIPHHWISLSFFSLWLVFLSPRGPGGAPNWNTNVVYLACCIPVHIYKLTTLYYKPRWAVHLLYPVLFAHWCLLLSSQWYLFATCPCSAYGCWYTGTVWMFVGGWGMVGYTLHNRFNTVIIGSSRALGNPITLYDCPRLLMGYDIPVPTPAAPRLAAAAAESAASARGAADAVAPVTVELVFKAAGKAGAGAPVKAAQAPAGSPVQPRRRGAAPARRA